MLSDVAEFFISSFLSTLILGVLFSVGELFSAMFNIFLILLYSSPLVNSLTLISVSSVVKYNLLIIIKLY